MASATQVNAALRLETNVACLRTNGRTLTRGKLVVRCAPSNTSKVSSASGPVSIPSLIPPASRRQFLGATISSGVLQLLALGSPAEASRSGNRKEALERLRQLAEEESREGRVEAAAVEQEAAAGEAAAVEEATKADGKTTTVKSEASAVKVAEKTAERVVVVVEEVGAVAEGEAAVFEKDASLAPLPALEEENIFGLDSESKKTLSEFLGYFEYKS